MIFKLPGSLVCIFKDPFLPDLIIRKVHICTFSFLQHALCINFSTAGQKCSQSPAAPNNTDKTQDRAGKQKWNINPPKVSTSLFYHYQVSYSCKMSGLKQEEKKKVYCFYWNHFGAHSMTENLKEAHLVFYNRACFGYCRNFNMCKWCLVTPPFFLWR